MRLLYDWPNITSSTSKVILGIVVPYHNKVEQRFLAIMAEQVADLSAPFERDIILEVRSSKMKTMPGLSIQTGIDKQIRNGSVPVSTTGLQDDEHDLIFHGGPDKAVHGCTSHLHIHRAQPCLAVEMV